jgi:hypothetical protein
VSTALTSLANVKAWVNSTSITDDLLLSRLIDQASRLIYGYLQRPILFQHTCTEIYDGSGTRRQMLKQWPVLSVGSLSVGTHSITAASSYGQRGFILEPWDGTVPGNPQALNLFGYEFWNGMANVYVTYTAGYVVQNEAWTVPASAYQIQVTAPYGSWAVDQGVTYATGTALTLVTANPTQGQYAVSNGVYTFAAADSGSSVLISYSFIPFDIEQACIEMVAERYRYKDRIGTASKTLGGQETMAYSLKDMQDYVRLMLQPYKKVILC